MESFVHAVASGETPDTSCIALEPFMLVGFALFLLMASATAISPQAPGSQKEVNFRKHHDCLTNMRFADDVLLFASSKEQLQKMLCDFKKSTEKVGLRIHPDKMKEEKARDTRAR